MRALEVYAPDIEWVPAWLMHWCSEPWVNRGNVIYVLREGHWDRKDLNHRDRWPRVLGKHIADPGYDPTKYYPIPVAMFTVGKWGTTLYDERLTTLRALQL